MKKVILAAIAFMAFGFANAQDARFGLKGGIDFSNFTGDTEGIDFKSRVGFTIGGFVEIKFSEKFAIQPEILYATQGAKVKNFGVQLDNWTYVVGNVNFNLAYINVPLMFKYYASEGFALEAGPQIGFLTSAKSKTTVNGYNRSHEMNVKDSFQSIDFALNFGASYDFTKNVSIDGRYNLGLANIAKTEAGDETKLHNSVFLVTLGYKF